jgi:Xaa-Pro aminopeptidase
MLLNRERAVATMDELGIDALVATTPENVYYLSDYGNQHCFHFAAQGMSAAILPLDESIPPTLLVQAWELPYVSERPSWMPELRVQTTISPYVPDDAELAPHETRIRDLWRDGAKRGLPNRQRLLGRTLAELGLDRARLAFDDPWVMLELQEHEVADATCREALNLFRHIRLIKTADELDLLNQACTRNQAALESAAGLLGEGVATGVVLNQYLAAMAAQGGYGSHVTGGGVDRTWHTYPDQDYRLQRGDLYVMDPAGHYRYYWADLGRSAQIGGPTPKFELLYGALQACHEQVVPMFLPGVATTDIKRASEESVRVEMPKGFFPALHSIGIEQYDHPQPLLGEFLSEDFTLEEGMVVNFETPYIEFPWGGLQLEDTFQITADGPVRLSSLPLDPIYAPAG